MFQNLDLTLKAILDDPKAPAELLKANKSSIVPDKGYLPKDDPTVNLFLHGVRRTASCEQPPTVLSRMAL